MEMFKSFNSRPVPITESDSACLIEFSCRKLYFVEIQSEDVLYGATIPSFLPRIHFMSYLLASTFLRSTDIETPPAKSKFLGLMSGDTNI